MNEEFQEFQEFIYKYNTLMHLCILVTNTYNTFIINTVTYQQINYIHYNYSYLSTNQLHSS